jgi:hypothetical protein
MEEEGRSSATTILTEPQIILVGWCAHRRARSVNRQRRACDGSTTIVQTAKTLRIARDVDVLGPAFQQGFHKNCGQLRLPIEGTALKTMLNDDCPNAIDGFFEPLTNQRLNRRSSIVNRRFHF